MTLVLLILFLTIFSLNNAIAYFQPMRPNHSPMPPYSSIEIDGNNDLSKRNATESNTATTTISSSSATTASSLIVKLLSNNLENRLQNAGSILNVTSKLAQVRNISFAYLLNETLSTLHGIPQNADIEKRAIAQNILSGNKDFQIILFIMPNGDIYFDEPYSRQEISTVTNLAFRDYFQGAISTNDTYLGNAATSASSGQMQALIAVPVYSLKDNSTIVGVWAGGINFEILSMELQSLNLTAAGERVVYVDHNGNKIADSDENKANLLESFSSMTAFKNAAINRESCSTIETIGNTKMVVTYHPVEAFHNTWAVLLIQSLKSSQTIELV
jgi:hypothetical protein